jgi:hypothetical protein
MKIWILVVIALVFFYYSEFNQKKINGFSVHYTSNAESAEIFAELDRRIVILKKHLQKKYGCQSCGIFNSFNMRERTEQLFENYKKQNFREISPLNLSGSTSYTEGKGRRVVMCLRDLQGRPHDINTIMFVTLHEITHVMNSEWGHGTEFWQMFRLVLENAVECGIYKSTDYSKYPQNYCGIVIDQSPLYLGKLNPE